MQLPPTSISSEGHIPIPAYTSKTLALPTSQGFRAATKAQPHRTPHMGLLLHSPRIHLNHAIPCMPCDHMRQCGLP